MATQPVNPYQLLGVSPTATSKELTIAYTKAVAAGRHDRAVLAEALASLTNEPKRTEVDVLIVGEAPLDVSVSFGQIDSGALLASLAADTPTIDVAAFTPWAELLPAAPALESIAIEPVPPEIQKSPITDAEPNIEFPL
jgi:hypothetical protein